MEHRTHVTRTFSFLLITLCVYYLLWQGIAARVELPVYYYARLIELLSVFLFVALSLFTPMRFEEMGILVPRTLLFRSLALGGGVALGFFLLLAALAARSGHTLTLPVGDVSRTTYFLVAPLQEVLSKSVMYYSFELCFEKKHPHLTNLMCALTFALFHVVYGVRMMLLSMLLCLITGWLFHKYRCVWGCAVVHFALGFFPGLFGF